MADTEQMAPEDERKLFVGGLPQEAKDTDIKEYFETFGEIENITLKTDPNTGRSRGFAFVLFKDPAGLNAASADESHVVKGKKVTCKKAEAKQGKIYVGKLPSEGLSNEDIQAHFATFGAVAEVVRPVDKANNDTPRNFAFVTFEKEEIAKQLVKEGTTNINGNDVDIKRVTPKDNGRGGMRGGGFGGGYGGYGDPYAMYGGYGGYGDPYGYGAYGGYGGYGGAGGKVRGGGRGRGRGRSRPY
eukprot:TRINITY_DN2555_c0_g1_i1.p1 TRINITY_DN2555_c0_g1~~TRINITY_DN2555_c0_g1_i1.p1  ORF type:complete len:243 (-),score=79.01 TRINITY_DN2555_c0_g1_i1:106-834(-)